LRPFFFAVLALTLPVQDRNYQDCYILPFLRNGYTPISLSITSPPFFSVWDLFFAIPIAWGEKAPDLGCAFFFFIAGALLRGDWELAFFLGFPENLPSTSASFSSFLPFFQVLKEVPRPPPRTLVPSSVWKFILTILLAIRSEKIFAFQ